MVRAWHACSRRDAYDAWCGPSRLFDSCQTMTGTHFFFFFQIPTGRDDVPGVYYGPHNTQLKVVNLQFSVVIYGVEGPEQTIISCDYNGVKGVFGLAEKGGMKARIWVSCTPGLYIFLLSSEPLLRFYRIAIFLLSVVLLFTSPLEHPSPTLALRCSPGPGIPRPVVVFQSVSSPGPDDCQLHQRQRWRRHCGLVHRRRGSQLQSLRRGDSKLHVRGCWVEFFFGGGWFI